MAVSKLSQIANAPAPPALTDTVIGVSSGSTDYQFSLSQIATTVAPSRTKLSGNTNFYVATTGSDSNTGLSSGQAWATLQHADNIIAQTYDLAGFIATVNISSGSYAGIENTTGYFTSVGGGTVNYIGDTVTPTNVRITGSASHQVCWAQFAANVGSASVGFDGIDFHPGGNSAIWVDPAFVASVGGSATIGALNGNWQVSSGANNSCFSGNITLAGTGTIVGTGFTGGLTAMLDDGTQSDSIAGLVFQEATITITGNPNNFGWLLFFVANSRSRMTGSITGAYQTGAFLLANASVFLANGDWFGSNFGSPNFISGVERGASFAILGTSTGFLGTLVGLQASGGQTIGVVTNSSAPTSGFSITLGNYDGVVILDPAGALTSGTITLPPHPMDQMRINIRSSQAITGLTISANSGQTAKGTPTSLTAGGTTDAIYNATNTTWYF